MDVLTIVLFFVMPAIGFVCGWCCGFSHRELLRFYKAMSSDRSAD